MCTNPILIRNKKFRPLHVDVRTSFVKVPCGICDECLRKRSKDLYLRARFESEECFKNNGCGFMCTLTYDDSNVPILEFQGCRYMVFNKEHCIKFIKRLRSKLDRFYRKHFGVSAPDFKYLITSEFGVNPFCTHRPHYHLIILFHGPISFYIFNQCFKDSLKDSRTGESFFGKIYQCDPLDISKGGIKYSCKYILKDQTYSNQNKIIRDLINFNIDKINQEFDIVSFPVTEDDFFHNKCIRSTKKYKSAVKDSVLKYKHMLQFYMVSNDFGCSAIIKRYGDSLFSLGCLNIDKFPYSIPKSVIDKVERVFGTSHKDKLVKSVFMNRFSNILDNYFKDSSSFDVKTNLYNFVDNFIISKFGCLYLVPPSGIVNLKYFNIDDSDFSDSLLEDFRFFDDNDFFSLRNKVIEIIDSSNSSDNLFIRSKIARSRTEKERSEYLKKKFNKS